MSNVKLYRDGGREYLELHAMRAPVGGYATWVTLHDEAYNIAVQDAVQDFEHEHKVEVFQLGRSGRHICIEDTEANRARYPELQRAAIAAAEELWQAMRTEVEPDAVRSEN